MNEPQLPASLRGARIHLVGAKGTGMAALAEILAANGARLSGSDVGDRFYTDDILASIGLKLSVGFDAAHVPSDAEIVIHSAAYRRDQNPELLEAARRGLVVMNYPEALGSLSRRYDSSGIAGVHGKTTTTAMAGSLISALALPATILAGSAVASFGNRSTKIVGDRYFVAETCEYRRHFLSFRPKRIILTSVESDHQDFYPTYADILAAFVDYACLLPSGGSLIYCADDKGAREAVSLIAARRTDIVLIPYGETAPGPYRMLSYKAASGVASFRLAGLDTVFSLHVPGKHLALDASAAVALALCLLGDYRGGVSSAAGLAAYAPTAAELSALSKSLASFSGSKRRSEILGEAGGVLFMDDYGHHPTAIRDTIAGIKAFWPERRLIVDFMSHTYSRTAALFDEFSACLDGADRVVLHKIYPSARETPDPKVSGRKLYEAVRARRGKAKRGGEAEVSYHEEVMDAFPELRKELREGDLFLTMGAGDNFRLGEALLADRKAGEGA
jgi:UDP-N-acetylmuramate--alanine ligase